MNRVKVVRRLVVVSMVLNVASLVALYATGAASWARWLWLLS